MIVRFLFIFYRPCVLWIFAISRLYEPQSFAKLCDFSFRIRSKSHCDVVALVIWWRLQIVKKMRNEKEGNGSAAQGKYIWKGSYWNHFRCTNRHHESSITKPNKNIGRNSRKRTARPTRDRAYHYSTVQIHACAYKYVFILLCVCARTRASIFRINKFDVIATRIFFQLFIHNTRRLQ